MGKGIIFGCLIIIAVWGASCSDKKAEIPSHVRFSMNMATEEAGLFENYIHSLHIYAFRKTAENKYVYARTLGELDQTDIKGLKDTSPRGDAKYFTADLAVGTYTIYAVGNAAGQLQEELIEDVSTPVDLIIKGSEGEEKNIYFLGNVMTTVVTDYMQPVKITLQRAVSKLVLVLYGVPVEIDSLRLVLGNIAAGISVDGRLTQEGKQVAKVVPVRKIAGAAKDTLTEEIITLPSLPGGADFRLLFYAAHGQTREKVMPVQTLLPDHYVRITGIIDDKPGSLLSFEVKIKLVLVDYWLDRDLPDFTLNKKTA